MLWVSVWKLGITCSAGFARKTGGFPWRGGLTVLPRDAALAAKNLCWRTIFGIGEAVRRTGYGMIGAARR
jgi:hypothetical protein